MFHDTKKAAEGNGSAVVERGRTPSAKQVRWKLKETGIELMTITPAVAQAMLDYNTKNRPLNERRAHRLANQMQKGEWRLTFSPIVFAKSGRLQDGQHRLRAVVISGVSIQAYVAFGDADENFAFLDTGRPRNGADIFAINGVTRAAMMSAASRWVLGYDSDNITSEAKGAGETTIAQLYAFFIQHPKLMESVPVGEAFARSKLAPPSAMAAMHYICARKNRAVADEFFTNVATSSNLKRNSPAWKLHQVMVKNASENHRTINAMTLCAYTIKAWNATRDGLENTHLKWRGERAPDEAFPKAR